MKKTIAAMSALTLAACGGNTENYSTETLIDSPYSGIYVLEKFNYGYIDVKSMYYAFDATLFVTKDSPDFTISAGITVTSSGATLFLTAINTLFFNCFDNAFELDYIDQYVSKSGQFYRENGVTYDFSNLYINCTETVNGSPVIISFKRDESNGPELINSPYTGAYDLESIVYDNNDLTFFDATLFVESGSADFTISAGITVSASLTAVMTFLPKCFAFENITEYNYIEGQFTTELDYSFSEQAIVCKELVDNKELVITFVKPNSTIFEPVPSPFTDYYYLESILYDSNDLNIFDATLFVESGSPDFTISAGLTFTASLTAVMTFLPKCFAFNSITEYNYIEGQFTTELEYNFSKHVITCKEVINNKELVITFANAVVSPVTGYYELDEITYDNMFLQTFDATLFVESGSPDFTISSGVTFSAAWTMSAMVTFIPKCFAFDQQDAYGLIEGTFTNDLNYTFSGNEISCEEVIDNKNLVITFKKS